MHGIQESVFDVLDGIFYKAFTSSTVALFFRKPQSALNGGVCLNEEGLIRIPDLLTTETTTSPFICSLRNQAFY